MTTEELLRPRIKVIAPMPFMVNKVGDLLNRHVNLYGKYFFTIHFNDGSAKSISVDDIIAYPHLFKLLNWWEERDIEDMPEYVKWADVSPINPNRLLPESGMIEKAKAIKWGKSFQFEVNSQINSIQADYFIPATLTDYQNQSK